MSLAGVITEARGGTCYGTWGAFPAPGHSAHDRSVVVRDRGDGDVLIHCFAGDDWRCVRDDLRRDGLLPEWEPEAIDSATRAQLDRERRAAKAARTCAEAHGHAEAAARAVALYGVYGATLASHQYLSDKQLPPIGVRQHRGLIVVAIGDLDGRLSSLQFIGADGRKCFLTGGRTKGNCWRCGELPKGSDPILIGEGWATCAALHLATGHPVVAALNAGNLELVARSIRVRCPSATIIVCADIDLSGVGETKATAAAAAVRGMVARPPRPRDWPSDRGLDFADVRVLPGGRDAICAGLRQWS